MVSINCNLVSAGGIVSFFTWQANEIILHIDFIVKWNFFFLQLREYITPDAPAWLAALHQMCLPDWPPIW